MTPRTRYAESGGELNQNALKKTCKNKHGENCIAQVVCWHFVRLCGAAGVGCEVSDEKKQSKPIHILTALFTNRIHKENIQV